MMNEHTYSHIDIVFIRIYQHRRRVLGMLMDMLSAPYKLIQLKMHYSFAPEAYNHANQAM